MDDELDGVDDEVDEDDDEVEIDENHLMSLHEKKSTDLL
jgi:hypothetical protein